MGNLGGVVQSLGLCAEAREHHENCLARSREVGDRRGEAIALLNLGMVWIDLGEPRRAAEWFRASLALCREIAAPYPEGFALMGLGHVADLEGDPAAAARVFEECLALRRAIGQSDGVAETLLELADIRRRTGDAEGARTALDESVALTREQGATSKLVRGLALLACLPGGDARAAEAALADAGESGDARETRLVLWQATHDRVHLVNGKRLLDDHLARNPAQYHDAMRKNVRWNREILEACTAEGIA
jgi:tetratricopeptide (TPR) repeat protein